MKSIQVRTFTTAQLCKNIDFSYNFICKSQCEGPYAFNIPKGGNNAESRHRRPTFGGNNGGFLGLFNTTDSNPFENFNSVNLTLPTDIAQFLSNLFSGNFPFRKILFFFYP